MAQIIPLTSAPRQSLSVTLTVDGASLALNLAAYYAEIAGYWVLSISTQQGVLLVDSIPLITGSYPAANILAPYAYLAIGSAYVINVSATSDDIPNAASLGTDFELWWDDTAA